MRCQGCDYPLWNLTARVCPECGRPFTPSQFEFVPNSVRFCCPHCNQDYYGTGPRGHLIPAEFDCVRCHQHITMDQMVLLPTEGVHEEQTRTDSMPWLERRQIGRIKAWYQTILRVLFEPTRLARSIPADSSAAQAWWFAILTNALFASLAAVPFMAIFLFAAVATTGTRGPGPAAVLFLPMAMFAGLMAFAIALPVWAAAAHALLRCTGPTQSGLSVTLRSLCYASGANIIGAVPCLGVYLSFIGWVWVAISATFMLRSSQRVSGLRAAIAVFALPVILTVGFIALWIFTVATVISTARFQAASAGAAVAAASSQAQTHQVLTGLFAHFDRNNAFPDHALRLVHDNDLSIYTLAADPSTAQVGNTSLAGFQLLPSGDEKSLVETLARQLPPDVTAHRLGDYIFTYHGIDPGIDSGLWLIIHWPPSGRASPPTQNISVATADRTVHTIPAASFLTELAAQNQLRAAHNLPPLPDPGDITTDKPATSQSPSPPAPDSPSP